ncbi:MAG: hypothetical protein JHC23_00560 [Sulfolobus sp.]|nr:hypothetical protein [Sulfolobus sp.]
MEPHEVAKLVIGRVERQCELTSGDVLECLDRHPPYDLDKFIHKYLTKEEKRVYEQKMEENPFVYWDKVLKEYAKLWDEKMSSEIGNVLANIIEELYETDIALPEGHEHLNTGEINKRLKHLKDIIGTLNKLNGVIKYALKTKEPLPEYELYHLLYEVGVVTVGLDDGDYYEAIKYYTDLYDKLSDTSQLNVLKTLSDAINGVISNIEKDLNKLFESKALVNEM